MSDQRPSKEVIIDGVRYVPVIECTPTAKKLMVAFVELYMGNYDHGRTEELADQLKVSIDEYHKHSPTITEVVADLTKSMANLLHELNDGEADA